jgi:hypothetical protein
MRGRAAGEGEEKKRRRMGKTRAVKSFDRITGWKKPGQQDKKN